MVRDNDRYDAVVVGAGFAGLYALYKLREIGLTVVCLEQGAGVGGTWYWNRYPGARCDVPSVAYSYSFSEELQQEWEWSERYAAQPEIEAYMNHVADRFDLRRNIEFNSRVTSAEYNESAETWAVQVHGRSTGIDARYLVFATGGYSKPFVPPVPGADDFGGELFATHSWPKNADVTGKRIGVVGTGSSGMQTATAIAGKDPAELYIFQRTPNFAVPARNRPVDAEQAAEFKKNYSDYREASRRSRTGTLYEGPEVRGAAMTDAEFEAHMEYAKSIGGAYVYGGVVDFAIDDEVNTRLQDYLRREIHRRVDDPETARRLEPHGYALGSRRVLIEDGYYEIFNKKGVELVDLREEGPIEALSKNGIVTARREIPLDMVIFATGFDSGTGAILAVDPVGRNGQTLRDKWADGPVTYLGLLVNNFPNMFMIAGPGSPSIRSQVLVSIEQHVDWLAELLVRSREQGCNTIEATSTSERRWTEHVDQTVEGTILARHRDTQYWGANVPGKPGRYLAYVGGVGFYRELCERVAEAGYPGLSCPQGDTRREAAEWDGPPADMRAPTRFGNTVI
ncbi:NAD(P)/FAD-dependent oxidoreductase [Okibacterium endophyticum]